MSKITLRSDKTEKFLRIILLIIAVLVCLKSIFIDMGFDQAYSIAMSYRHLNGDRLMIEMWETHQTSIFVTDLLMALYHMVIPSYTGVSIFLNVCGTIMIAGVSFLLYGEVKSVSGEFVAFLSALFLLVYRAKVSAFPDYTNLSVCFSVITFVLLIRFLGNEKKICYLVFAAFALCGQIIAYPSTILVYAGVVIILALYSKNKLKNGLVFTGVCGACGVAYAGYFVIRIGFERLAETLRALIAADLHASDYDGPYTKSSWIESGLYYSGALKLILCAAIVAVAVYLLLFAVGLIAKKKIAFTPVYAGALALSEVFIMLLWKPDRFPDWLDFVYILPLILMILSIPQVGKMEQKQRQFWILGVIISLLTMFATSFLSNMKIFLVAPYLVLAGVVSFTAVSKCKKGVAALILILLMAMFRTGYFAGGYSQIADEKTISQISLGSFSRKGPNIGIISNYAVSGMEKAAMDEFKSYISAEDKVFYVGGWIFNPILFLMTDAEVANPTTIDTPYYNKQLDTYFEMNPQKTPTIFVVEMLNGEPAVGEDAWILQWIHEKGYTERTGSGYWRYYRKAE